MVDVPHFAYPFRLGARGRFAVVEQDTVDQVAQNVEIILRTTVGSRVEIPEFGVPELLFDLQRGDGGAEIEEAILEWEPRADVVFEDEPDRLDELIRNVRVSVSVGGTGEEA